ncbi:MAG TPA: peptide deformylase [Candidatus Hydrogenedentes bacterium]|jgi:peptide deformylase|nr:MAG: Peptide deformylase [Candidatus Hydrogenedentes bacterium ADurb.Bin101]HOC69213.1 peptide deformylase [Candidatus Hydrogenedentota bacterium]HQN00358.1 peptide deformylase [Candidatus Hydrogenedentota bacterium]
MNIVLYPDAPLRKKALRIEHFGPELARLAEEMVEIMMNSDGVGLAAPQVGISRQLLVLCEPESDPVCLINPEIVEMEGNAYGEEGCLSLPGLYASVPRATRIRVLAQDCDGNHHEIEAHDFLARIIQHEYDHLQGIVFPERLDVLTRNALLEEWSAMRNGMRQDSTVTT